MLDKQTLAEINGEYTCPAWAGPAWRSAMDYGFDMSLVADALEMKPEQRLAEHQQVINSLVEVQEAGRLHGAK